MPDDLPNADMKMNVLLQRQHLQRGTLKRKKRKKRKAVHIATTVNREVPGMDRRRTDILIKRQRKNSRLPVSD